jgi:ubiquinone/menaquinone biosynthesis C-methylase UbiE
MADSAFWDSRALKYGHTGWYDFSTYAFDQQVRLLVMNRIIREEVSSRQCALDFGTGTGDFAGMLSEIFKHVKAFDISSQVCQIAEEKFRDNPNITIMHDEAIYDCTIEPASLDLVLSVTVLQHINNISEIDKILKFFYEIIKPNGHLIVLEFAPIDSSSSTNYQTERSFYEWVEAFDRQDFMMKKYYGFYHPSLSPVTSYKNYHSPRLFRVLKLFYAFNSVKEYLNNRASAMIDDASEYYWTGRPDDPMKIMILQKRNMKEDSD